MNVVVTFAAKPLLLSAFAELSARRKTAPISPRHISNMLRKEDSDDDDNDDDKDEPWTLPPEAPVVIELVLLSSSWAAFCRMRLSNVAIGRPSASGADHRKSSTADKTSLERIIGETESSAPRD